MLDTSLAEPPTLGLRETLLLGFSVNREARSEASTPRPRGKSCGVEKEGARTSTLTNEHPVAASVDRLHAAVHDAGVEALFVMQNVRYVAVVAGRAADRAT